MKKLVIGVLLSLITAFPVISNANPEEIVDLSKGQSYSSVDYYTKALELSERYSEILKLEVIGESVDKKPIYSLIMTENVEETMSREDINVYRQHYFIEAGTHARETINPAIVMKMIEDYSLDYYDDSHISEFNIKNELSEVVLHFIPLVNPDGHDLSKFGISSVTNQEGKEAISKVTDKNYSGFKSNLNGVDINRNFPDEYYDNNQGKLVDKFQKHIGEQTSWVPSNEFYGGVRGGSEPETQAIMGYILRYDFRNFLSYHSRGNVIYTAKHWFSEEYNNREKRLGEIASKVTGYELLHSSTGKGSGFLSDFTAAQTLKPNVTVETTISNMPTAQKYFSEAYNRTKLVPLYFTVEGRTTGYFKYRLYVDNKYIRDFSDFNYAKDHAEILGGIIVESEGVPENNIINPITRKDFVIEIVQKNYNIKELTVDSTDTFNDDKSIITTFAKNNGILSHGNGNFRPNDYTTVTEASSIIYKTDKILNKITSEEYLGHKLEGIYPEWAVNPVKYVLYYNKLNKEAFKNDLLSKEYIEIK